LSTRVGPVSISSRTCWQVPKSQVYRLAREGRIPTVAIGRYYRFRLDAIEAWESRVVDAPVRAA
jgi:excisionase family DNA binding protein